MNWNWKEYNKQKTLFRSYYCSACKQTKPCHLLSDSKCCSCYFQNEQERAREYSSYEKVLISKQKEQVVKYKQYQLLKNYLGCKRCGNLSVDACFLYDENKLVCQPCLVRKGEEASSPISFLGKQKWYKKQWGIDLAEWLIKYRCLPVNADCAREWLKDKEHLKKQKDPHTLLW